MHPLCTITVNTSLVYIVLHNNTIIMPCCVFVLVVLPERIQRTAQLRAPNAVVQSRIAISESRPEFGKRILEERRPLMHTHVNDDWFVLLDVGPKKSGICFTSLCCCFQLARGHTRFAL